MVTTTAVIRHFGKYQGELEILCDINSER